MRGTIFVGDLLLVLEFRLVPYLWVLDFTALLQEPEAKWIRVGESKGVTISQLDSMDRSLTIQRAEAVFVGVSLWDLFAILMVWGAKSAIERMSSDATLLEHVNEMSELWRIASKGRP